MDLEITRGLEVLVSILVVLFGGIVLKLFRDLIWKPFAFHNAYTAQGIRGPSYHVVGGNIPEMAELLREVEAEPMKEISHDIVPRVTPQFHKWSRIHGETFFYWYGAQSRLYIPEPEIIKEILSEKFGYYEKNKPRPLVMSLIGNGLVFITGLQWVKHRRIVSHAFHVDKLKTMVKTMAGCTLSMLDKWQETVAQGGDSDGKEIDVHHQFRALTADIISHTAFGSSYIEGKEVFELQRELQVIASESESRVHIPGSQYIPTSKNRYTWNIDRRVKQILKGIIKSRLNPKTEGADVGYGNDLLGIMLTANKKELSGNQKNLSMTIDEIMEECKTFFFAGHETTSNLLTWTLFLLAVNPEWQERLRNEVISVCGTDVPDADMHSSLKLMTMVLCETLRLYPPAAVIIIRKALQKMKVANLMLPKGAELIVPILGVHHSKRFWGEDANIFNPERFSEGSVKACSHPNAFIPFSMGPRSCVGQNFSLMEAKIALSMILQRFSFSLSPSYKHAPTAVLTLQPKNGMQIIFKSTKL